MKKASVKRRKHTTKKKQHNSQPASSHSSQQYVAPPEANSLPLTLPPQLTSLPSVVPPQQTSLPPNIPSPSTSLPPGFPPLSTSLPPSFFSVPPPGPIKNYSTASQGMNTSLDYNIVPTPHINSSSSCHISQNGNSSSQIPSLTPAESPTSSTPSISMSNIGIRIPASPSISSTIAPAFSRTQNVGDTREYDSYHRLIITLDKDGFAPSYVVSHMVSESIQPFFNDAWGRWKDFPYNIKEQIWNQFRSKCAWQPCYENKINFIFEKKARIRVVDVV